MSTGLLATCFDLLLAAAMLWCAWNVLRARGLHRAVVMFIVFGLLMALAWARMKAPDIGMAEAAIGAGLTGALLLDAYGSLRRRHAEGTRPKHASMRFVVVPAAIFAIILIAGMLQLAPAVGELRPLVMWNLPSSGVEHPVTAVLLNYRGYDTLLEIAVLVIAVLGILAAAIDRQIKPVTASGPLPRIVAQIAVPLTILVAIYLLWAGASRAGGAFQAGAVLAASAVLLHLTGFYSAWPPPGRLLRFGLACGFLTFLVVAAATLAAGTLLRYPPAQAGSLILLIESALTVSLGITLTGLFLFLSTGDVNQP